MRNWIFLIGVVGLASQGLAEVKEKPIKLEGQGDTNGGQIYFPPATEPYKPVDLVPEQGPKSQPEQGPKEPPKSYVYETRTTPPIVQQNFTNSVPFSNVPNSTYTPGMPIGREAIEQAAKTCESQLTQLWQKKSISDPARRAKFQKSMGEAKYRCDQLKELAKNFEKADADLNTFHFNVQQAEEASN